MRSILTELTRQVMIFLAAGFFGFLGVALQATMVPLDGRVASLNGKGPDTSCGKDADGNTIAPCDEGDQYIPCPAKCVDSSGKVLAAYCNDADAPCPNAEDKCQVCIAPNGFRYCQECDTNDNGIPDTCNYVCNHNPDPGNDSCYKCDSNGNGHNDACFQCDLWDLGNASYGFDGTADSCKCPYSSKCPEEINSVFELWNCNFKIQGPRPFQANGCTGVPDNPCLRNNTDFVDACTRHDIGYETCNKSKASTDATFRAELTAICTAAGNPQCALAAC